jgi:hypothetical protein
VLCKSAAMMPSSSTTRILTFSILEFRHSNKEENLNDKMYRASTYIPSSSLKVTNRLSCNFS